MASSSPRRLLLASGNAGKARELRLFLRDLPLEVLTPSEAGLDLPTVEEDGATFRDNAVKKALAAAACCPPGMRALADDSGLAVAALGGDPGVRSARFAGARGSAAQVDAANNRRLLERLAGRRDRERAGRFICVLALAAPARVLATARGSVAGIILEAPRGTGGFGYDPLFHHPPSGRTFAELDAAGKLAVSHRGRALARLQRLLAAGGLDAWW